MDLGYVLNPMAGVLVKMRGHAGTQERRPCEDGVETAVTQPQAQQRLGPPEARRGRKDSSPEPSSGRC